MRTCSLAEGMQDILRSYRPTLEGWTTSIAPLCDKGGVVATTHVRYCGIYCIEHALDVRHRIGRLEHDYFMPHLVVVIC